MILPPKYTLSVILIVCMYIDVISQNASGYNFQAFTSSYVALTGTTNVPGHTSTSDNAVSSAVNIGFPFKFAGNTYTQLYVSSNGWVSFSATTNSQPTNAWIEMNAQRPTLFPLWDDLQNRNIPRYKIEGITPNRIFKLEWYQSEWNASSNGNVISFQLWLHETSNIIDFRYLRGGTNVTSGSASIGIFDHNGKHLALSNASASPTPQNGPLATNISTKPANHQVYRFTPPQYNVSFSNVNYGEQIWCAGETRNVSIQVTNRGTSTLTNIGPTINIGAKWDADATYTFKVPANNLTPGNTTTYTLPITAPLNAGVNHLTFDVIIEGSCEFASNIGLCSSDNSVYPSNHIIIKEIPQIDAGPNTAICGGSTMLSGSTSGIYEPIVIFQEGFESYSNHVLTTSSPNWRLHNITTSTTNFQITEDCTPINGTKCLNMNDGLGTNCDYRWQQVGNIIAYKLTPISAIGYSNLSLNFKWKAYGESTDYGKIVYSTNGTTWVDLSPTLNYQSEWSNYNNLSLPASLNNSTFYLGFRWVSGGGTGAAPGLAIDDILLLGNTGVQQPVNFSWSPTIGIDNPTILNPIATPTNSTTYTLSANSSGCSSSDTVRIRIDEPSSIPTKINGLGTFCHGNSIKLSAEGSNLKGVSNYEWFANNCGTGPLALNDTFVVSPTQTTQYFVRASANGACPPSPCISGFIYLPTPSNALSINGDTASCTINENGFVHFYEISTGRLIASINSNGQNLGKVSIHTYVDGTPLLVQDCYSSNPNFATQTLQRHWVISPEFQPTNPVTVRLPYRNNEYSNLATLANTNANVNDDIPNTVGALHVSKYSGPNNINGDPYDNCYSMGGNINSTTLHAPIFHNSTTSTYYPLSIANAHFSDFSVNSFSEFWLHGAGNNSPLPITLSSFQTICEENNHIKLEWITASEVNNSHFSIEKSSDAKNWEQVTNILGSGNSNEPKFYTYIDYNTNRSISYYRLKQVDFDGSTETFSPKSVLCNESNNAEFKVYPNPTIQKCTIEFNSVLSNNGQLSIYDMTGRVVLNQKIAITEGLNQIQIDLDKVSAGVYIIKINIYDNLEIKTQVIKHKH